MKILVLGSSGLLGRELCDVLRNHNIDFCGTYHSNKMDDAVYIDFTDRDHVLQVFAECNPTICVISIVQRLVDVCENQWKEIKFTNIEIVNQVAKICADRNIYCIHISTDYVFDGSKQPYYPDSLPNPLQNYGISKLLSEYKIMNHLHSQNYAIIRVPVLYSDKSRHFEENAVTLIGKKVLDQTRICTEDNYSIRRPVFIHDFCLFLLDIIQNTSRFQCIYHFYNPIDHSTKYKMAQMIANFLHKEMDHIQPLDNPPNDGVERPMDTQLLDNRYDITKYNSTPLRDGIQMCFQKIYHPKIYKHRFPTDFFFLLDLDGTLVESDHLHLNAYKQALEENHTGIDLDMDLDMEKLLLSGVDDYLHDKIGDETKIQDIKTRKKEIMMSSDTDIHLVKGADQLIDFIHENNCNHCVVTNTSLDIINHLKKKCPPLQKLQHWISREDYIQPKPHKECYEKAVSLYYRNEPYLIGFENSWLGYKSIQHVTSIVYIMYNDHCPAFYQKIKKEDVYLINHYHNL